MSASVKLHPGVDSWDARLSDLLSDDQKELIASLAASSYERPYPAHLRHAPQQSDHYATPSSAVEANSELRELFETDLQGTVESLTVLESWFNSIQESIMDEKEVQVRELREKCVTNLSVVEDLLSQVDQTQSDLGELRSIYNQVSNQTNALHTSCEKLLEEENQLMSGVAMVSEKLNYFSEYDRIMQKLNSPIFSAKSASFPNLLQRIEECIDYLNKNPHYKESGSYLMLYRSAHSKAVVLMKTHFQSTLNKASELKSLAVSANKIQAPDDSSRPENVDQSTKGSGSSVSMSGFASNNSFSLLYGKFRAISASMKVIIEQLEERQDRFTECRQILEDCESIYFNSRQGLVGESVAMGVNDLLIRHKTDHCGLFRNGSFMLLQVCVDEWDLFLHFFSKPSERLDSFLQTLCNYLYDAVRPLIVHIIHLETLSELCSILKTEMLGDKVLSMKQRIPVFEQVCQQMLEDIQERLVYRTQMYIKSDIVGYSPVSGDLAYPEKLIMMRQIAQSLQNQNNSKNEVSSEGDQSSAAEESVDESKDITESGSQSGSVVRHGSLSSSSLTSSGHIHTSQRGGSGSCNDISPADMHGMWYPTLRRTLVCLSKLYRCLDIHIFRGLAQETLGCCVQSLVFAANQIQSRKSPTDAQLFFIKHLLILREQIQPFHSEFVVTETVLDFSRTRLAALGLFNKRERLFSLSRSNALLQFLIDGSPQVTELTVDSKKDVDLQLKKHCEVFVENCCKTLCEPLVQFLQKAKVIIELKKTNSSSKVALSQQPFANAKKLQDVVGSTNKLIKTHLPKLKDKMNLYLANKDTEAILFRPVMSRVVKVFADVHELLKEYYSEEDKQIVGVPSVEEIKLMLT